MNHDYILYTRLVDLYLAGHGYFFFSLPAISFS